MKVLSLDGGGVRGVGQGYILDQLSSSTNKFDVVAGTSIGALNGALYCMSGGTAKSHLHFFKEIAPQIFKRSRLRAMNPFGPKYGDKALNDWLKDTFKSIRLGDVSIPLFVTAADLNRERLKVFFSGKVDDGEIPLWEVMRMAVAAESYFSPWMGFGDGGIYANNPSMVLITGLIRMFGLEPSDIDLTSIGTGASTQNRNISTKYWTKVHWGAYLIGALLEGGAGSMHEMFTQKIGLGRYSRFQFVAETEWKFDDPEMVKWALGRWQDDLLKASLEIVKTLDAPLAPSG